MDVRRLSEIEDTFVKERQSKNTLSPPIDFASSCLAVAVVKMRRLGFRIASATSLSLCLLTPASATDSCQKWRVPLDWVIFQDNGFRLFFTFDKDQEHGIRGTVEGHHGTDLDGLFEGHVNAEKEKIVFTIHWSNGAVGGYEGTISPQGRVEGFTYDRNAKGSTAGFRAESMLNCVKWVSSTPSAPPPQTPSGPSSKPDATKNQQGSSGQSDVLTPEGSNGPSPFGEGADAKPSKPFDPDKPNIDVTPNQSDIRTGPRPGTNLGGGAGGDPR
jgi:hypothetical protein